MDRDDLLKQGWIEQKGEDYWLPEKAGLNLMGIVIDDKEHNEYGKSWLIEVDGERSWTPYHAILQSKMSKVKIGWLVYISYMGLRKDGKTRDYDVFSKNPQMKR